MVERHMRAHETDEQAVRRIMQAFAHRQDHARVDLDTALLGGRSWRRYHKQNELDEAITFAMEKLSAKCVEIFDSEIEATVIEPKNALNAAKIIRCPSFDGKKQQIRKIACPAYAWATFLPNRASQAPDRLPENAVNGCQAPSCARTDVSSKAQCAGTSCALNVAVVSVHLAGRWRPSP